MSSLCSVLFMCRWGKQQQCHSEISNLEKTEVREKSCYVTDLKKYSFLIHAVAVLHSCY